MQSSGAVICVERCACRSRRDHEVVKRPSRGRQEAVARRRATAGDLLQAEMAWSGAYRSLGSHEADGTYIYIDKVQAWRRGTHDPHTSWSCEFMYASWQLRQRFASGRCTPSGDPGGLRLGAVIGEPNSGCVDLISPESWPCEAVRSLSSPILDFSRQYGSVEGGGGARQTRRSR